MLPGPQPLTAERREALRIALARLLGELADPPPGEDAAALLPRAKQVAAEVRSAVADTAEDRAWLDRAAAAAEVLVSALQGYADKDGPLRLQRALPALAQVVSLLPTWARASGAVYDRTTGLSRYDPQGQELATYRIACPRDACRHEHLYAWSAAVSTMRFPCVACQRPFTVYLGEVLKHYATGTGVSKHHVLRTADLDGATRLTEFDEASGKRFSAEPGDPVVLVSEDTGKLRAAQNLRTAEHVWLPAPGPCFVATAVYGEGHPALPVLRAFRDRTLLPAPGGPLLVNLYYTLSPRLIARVGPQRLRRLRPALDLVVRWLS